MSQSRTIKLKIAGMSCDSCLTHVKNGLTKLQGVRGIQIDNWRDGNAEIIAEERVDEATVVKAVSDAGYQAVIVSDIKSPQAKSGTEAFDYDLIIIGGGSAAFAAALKASELDKKMLMVNDGLPIGGTCVNVGCVPSKTLIRTAEAFHNTKHTNFDSIHVGHSDLDFQAAIRQKSELVKDLRQQKYIDVVADDANIIISQGRGRLLDEHTVAINGDSKTAGAILIATGSSTYVPDIDGLTEVRYFTNETIYELNPLPEHLIVLGGRYIALENAQMFARLGSKVTLLQRSSRILPNEQSDITEQLTSYLQEEGIDIKTGVKIRSVTENENQIVVQVELDGDKQTIVGSHLFLATGRKGNTKNLGLEKIGIQTFGNGFVKVNDFLQTSVPNIFAAGDVIGENLYVYAAAYEGGLAVENALSDGQRARDYHPLPWVVFTDPQVAGVGLDEAQAQQAGIIYDVTVLSLADVPRALAARNTKGFIKLIRDKANDTLVGARILASEGSELLMEAALAIKYKIPVSELRQMLHPYLTLSEGIKLAAITFDKDVKKLSCCAV